MLPLQTRYHEDGSLDPINQSNPTTFFVPVTNQHLDFQRHMASYTYT